MVYRLTIEKSNGQCVAVCGTEEVLRQELDEWSKYEANNTNEWVEKERTEQKHVDPESYYVRTINGFADNAARSEVVLAYRFTDVVGMFLCQL